jgi:CHAT domain-containing protein
VSYTYSARYLLTQFTGNESSGQENFLGVAPVNYPSNSSLASLQGSDLSLKHIASYFRETQSLVSEGASRNYFQREFSNYKIIQLYTHASDSSSHGEPVIYFSDSALYLSDLIPE